MKAQPTFKRPSTWAVVRSVGQVTFTDIVRDKVLYNSVICAVLLMAAAYLASRLSFTRPERVVIDFGLTVINLASALIAIFIGAPMLGREFDRRTIYVALSKPVSRFQFLLGKYFGLISVLFVNWILLSVVYLGILYFVEGRPTPTLFSGMTLLFFQTSLIAAIAVMFSSMSTASVSAMLTLGLYLLGNNISQVRFVAIKSESPVARELLNMVARVVPNMEYFNLGTKVTYGLPVAASELVFSIFYSVLLSAALLCLAGLLVRHKDA